MPIYTVHSLPSNEVLGEVYIRSAGQMGADEIPPYVAIDAVVDAGFLSQDEVEYRSEFLESNYGLRDYWAPGPLPPITVWSTVADREGELTAADFRVVRPLLRLELPRYRVNANHLLQPVGTPIRPPGWFWSKVVGEVTVDVQFDPVDSLVVFELLTGDTGDLAPCQHCEHLGYDFDEESPLDMRCSSCGAARPPIPYTEAFAYPLAMIHDAARRKKKFRVGFNPKTSKAVLLPSDDLKAILVRLDQYLESGR